MLSTALERKSASLVRYPVLRDRVREALLAGRRKIEEAKVLTYLQTGKHIQEHLELNHYRLRHDHYGKQVIEKLAGDLNLGPTILWRCLRFAETFKILARGQESFPGLSWSHYRVLITVEDEAKRTELERRAIQSGWSAQELADKIRQESISASSKYKKLSGPSRASLPTPIKGKVGIYRIVETGNKLHWDRGFASYRELSPSAAARFKAGDFVCLKKGDKLEKVPDGRLSDLYTYEAELLRVIDADTFWMKVWLAPPDWRQEKLRLRGIDAPELNTKKGQAAKRFVERLFKKAGKITVTTTKPDKYHRYLSDVFLRLRDVKVSSRGTRATGHEYQALDNEEIFLNNLLLEKGHAVRTTKIPLTEWEKE